MSIELKPCPFCGGKAEFGGGDYGDGHTGYFVECLVCGTNDPLPNLSYSMEEVAEAWNTRAERTCYAKPHYSTRFDTLGTVIGFDCSECAYALTQDPDSPILWRYCPNCGAKVEE